MLCCPVCHDALMREKTRAVCEREHSFDLAKEGYLNLLIRQGQGAHGDDKAMLRARRAFLEKGYYAPLCEAFCAMACEVFQAGEVILDAGCGEGYYTTHLKDALDKEKIAAHLFAFDIAKPAAAMTAKRLAERGEVFVASSFAIPMASQSVFLLSSLFSPFAEKEFCRVLKKGGYLLRAVNAEDHLIELKQALYDKVRVSTVEDPALGEFETVGKREVRFPMVLDGAEAIRNLFQMTPFSHKTSPADKAKLEALNRLSVTVSVDLLLYRQKAGR